MWRKKKTSWIGCQTSPNLTLKSTDSQKSDHFELEALWKNVALSGDFLSENPLVQKPNSVYVDYFQLYSFTTKNS